MSDVQVQHSGTPLLVWVFITSGSMVWKKWENVCCCSCKPHYKKCPDCPFTSNCCRMIRKVWTLKQTLIENTDMKKKKHFCWCDTTENMLVLGSTRFLPCSGGGLCRGVVHTLMVFESIFYFNVNWKH